MIFAVNLAMLLDRGGEPGKSGAPLLVRLELVDVGRRFALTDHCPRCRYLAVMLIVVLRWMIRPSRNNGTGQWRSGTENGRHEVGRLPTVVRDHARVITFRSSRA